MRVFVTGGTGYVGSRVLQPLLEAGCEVVALVRDPAKNRQSGLAELVVGDLLEPATYADTLQGCQGCIHLAWTGQEKPLQQLLALCSHYQASRFILMSANGAERAQVTGFYEAKRKAERAVHASGLHWTVLRPAYIYGGNPRPEAQSKLQKLLQTKELTQAPPHFQSLKQALQLAPVFPYLGDGSYPVQPISATEVGQTLVACLQQTESVGKEYHLCGKESLTYLQLLQRLAPEARLVSVPESPLKGVAGLLSGLSWSPLKKEKLNSTLAGNACPDGALTQRDLGVPPLPLEL